MHYDLLVDALVLIGVVCNSLWPNWLPRWLYKQFKWSLLARRQAIRVSLDERDFRTLVADRVVGKISETWVVEMALQDIGWSRMILAIQSARDDVWP